MIFDGRVERNLMVFYKIFHRRTSKTRQDSSQEQLNTYKGTRYAADGGQ